MQEPASLFTWGNAWFRRSVLSLVLLTVVSILVGFVWLPAQHADFTAKGLWDSICRAAGVPSEWSTAKKEWPKPEARMTNVVMTPAMGRAGAGDAAGRGGTIAVQQCSMCHGAHGLSDGSSP